MTMSRLRSIGVWIAVLLVTTARLPAPVQEVEPEATATPIKSEKSAKRSSKPPVGSEGHEPKKRSQPESTRSFTGHWVGTASGRINQALVGQTGFSTEVKMDIGQDGRTVDWTSSAWIYGQRFHAVAQKEGGILTWTYQKEQMFVGHTQASCRMEMMANGTAKYSESSGLVGGAFKGLGYEVSGILTRH